MASINDRRRRRALMTTAAFLSAAASPVFAQAPAPAAPEATDVDVIVVTGTAIRGVAPVGSATVNIDRTTLVQSGVRDASSLVSILPQGSGLGSTLQNNAGRNAGVNLRGLGNSATLL